MAMAAATATTTAILSRATTHQSLQFSTSLFSNLPFTKPTSKFTRPITKLHVSSPTNNPSTTAAADPTAADPTAPTSTNPSKETIFFDGGAHYGDLVANIIFGFTLLWLPLTLAAVLRAFFLRYRFTNLRVTVISGLTGQDRSDFSYKVVKDVQVVPRFIGEWGDVIITLKDGTIVDLRSVPKFREIAKYCLSMVENSDEEESRPKGFGKNRAKGSGKSN